MATRESMLTATRRYLRERREWLAPNHPLAVAIIRTAEQLDRAYQTSTMAQYTKQIDQIERMAPAPGQGLLPGTGIPGAGLVGPRA